MSILVITFTQDNISVAEVIERMRTGGEHVFRLDTDRFPDQVSIRSQPTRLCTELESDDDRVDLSAVTAVWYRRNYVGRGLPREMPGDMRGVAIREARAALFGSIDALDCFQVDRFHAVRRAAQKPRQLAIAQSLGFEVPASLVTNDPEAVRAFAECHGPLIFKPVSDIVVGEDGMRQRMWTNRLGAAEMASLDGLELSPLIFQPEILKRVEVRATIIGRRVFAAAVDPAEADASDDWRRAGDALTESWTPYELPPDIEARLLTLMDRLDLQYGAADLIVTPEGRHVFLELNPSGEFCWLDKLTPLPLGNAMAALLVQRGAV